MPPTQAVHSEHSPQVTYLVPDPRDPGRKGVLFLRSPQSGATSSAHLLRIPRASEGCPGWVGTEVMFYGRRATFGDRVTPEVPGPLGIKGKFGNVFCLLQVICVYPPSDSLWKQGAQCIPLFQPGSGGWDQTFFTLLFPPHLSTPLSPQPHLHPTSLACIGTV